MLNNHDTLKKEKESMERKSKSKSENATPALL